MKAETSESNLLGNYKSNVGIIFFIIEHTQLLCQYGIYVNTSIDRKQNEVTLDHTKIKVHLLAFFKSCTSYICEI